MLLFLILAIIAIVLMISFYTYHTAFYSPKSARPAPDAPMTGAQYEAVAEHIARVSGIMARYPCEDVWITSGDGLLLHGRYYHRASGAPLVILFHGYRSHPFRDCGGGHSLSRKMGYNALVIDQRAHGNSGGVTITFGIKERRDCLKWIAYAIERFGNETPIVLSGLSMGAATVLMASGLELPKNVCCIMADSPYSAPSAIIEKVCADMRYPVALCRPFIHLGALLYGRFRLNACTAKKAVADAKVPILLIHGEADDFVPCDMSAEIADCCASEVTVRTFPGAGHGLSYITDPKGYERAVYEFLSTVPALQGTFQEDFVRQVYE